MNLIRSMIFWSVLVCLSGPVLVAQIPDSLSAKMQRLSTEERIEFLDREALHTMKSNPTLAMELAREALEMARSGSHPIGEARVHATLGRLCYFVGDFQQAIASFFTALSLFEQSGDKRGLCTVLTGLGDLHYDLDDLDNAMGYYQRILTIADDDENRAMAYNNIGIVYSTRNESDRAIEYFLKTIGYEDRVKNRKPVYDAYENLAMILEERENYDGALRFYEKALNMEVEDSAYEDICVTKLNLSTLHLTLNNRQKALELASDALEAAQRIGARPVELHAYSVLPRVYEAMGDYRSAFEFQRRHSALADSLFSESMTRKIAEARARFDFKDKNMQITELQREKSSLLWQILFVALITILLIVLLILLYRSSRRNRNDAQLLAELNEDLQKKNQELFLSENQLASLNVGKDKLFSVLAHDLKSPFTSLLGYLQVLDAEYDKHDREEHREFITIALQAATRLFAHVDTLLNWTRLQMGRMELLPEVVTISATVNGVFELLQKDADNKRIELKNEARDDITVTADPSMFRSLVQNLVTNAIKFTRRGGWVRVEAFAEPDWVHFSVTDNGIGMSDETRTKLFRLDTNVSRRGTDEESGTGLGLIICREIIEKHGGRISVHSAPDEGTTFFCSFPDLPLMETPAAEALNEQRS